MRRVSGWLVLVLALPMRVQKGDGRRKQMNHRVCALLWILTGWETETGKLEDTMGRSNKARAQAQARAQAMELECNILYLSVVIV
jgi:hypothetical protein